MQRIVAENLGKYFTRRVRSSAGREGWSQRWRRIGRRSTTETFWALRDVSFSVAEGEMLGVVGANGAGKSTLLTLLSGISEPSEGHVAIEGKLGALLELGGGFADDLTGRENAILAGVVAGLTRREVEERLDEIVAFAEVGSVLDDPVRTYSAGMRIRLAFSVSVHGDPDILLVDEYLSVGDLSFQARCRTRITELRAAGCAVVVVSHSLEDIRAMCDRVLLLQNGRLAALDRPEIVTRMYEQQMHERTLQRTQLTSVRVSSDPASQVPGERLGSREMEITAVRLLPAHVVSSGMSLVVEISYRTNQEVQSPVFGVSISRHDGILCVDTSTESARVDTSNLPSEGVMSFTIARLELGRGRYFVDVGIYESRWSHAYDYHARACALVVEGAMEHKGVLAPACRWSVLASSSVPYGGSSNGTAVLK